jgi:hypothetical protein
MTWLMVKLKIATNKALSNVRIYIYYFAFGWHSSLKYGAARAWAAVMRTRGSNRSRPDSCV